MSAKEAPLWAKWVRKKKPVFDAASGILEDLWHARGGNTLSTALAGVSALGKVVDLVYPRPNPWPALRREGLSYRHLAISGFIGKELLIHTEPEVIAADDDSKALVWRNEDGTPSFGAVASNSGFDLFLGPDGGVLLRELLDCVWNQGSELMITQTPMKDIIMTPMPKVGRYIGKRRPAHYVERMKKYGAGPRTILLRGPTGVGKSVLGRHISLGLGRENARTLKISSEVLRTLDEDEILALIQWLRPTVLLLDDLNLASSAYTQTFLALLEALRDPNTLVIATMMTDARDREEPPEKGSWHFDGMRPGRIEEIFTLYLPDAEEREEILGMYFKDRDFKVKGKTLKKMAKKTDGLSGAYLSNFVERVVTHGIGEWREELLNVQYMAPFPSEDDENAGVAEEKKPKKSRRRPLKEKLKRSPRCDATPEKTAR